MKILILFLLFILLADFTFAQEEKKKPVLINNPGKQYELIGELGEKLGHVLYVSGIIVEEPLKGYERGPNLLVQTINDKATQREIQIPVSPSLGKFGDQFNPEVKYGLTYRMEVYETGGYVGMPADVANRSVYPPQNSGFYFVNKLIVLDAKEISPIQWSPDKFIEQYALLSGIAKNEDEIAVIENANWKLLLTGCQKWTDSEIGKLAEVYGKIHETGVKGIYNVENSEPRLVNLEDQLGKTVKLRGIAWSMNGFWWFNYRGTDIYVENINKLPNWKVDNHGAAIEITGTLEQAKLPDIDQITEKSDRDLKLYYIVRKAGWKPLEGLLTPELKIQ